MKFCPKVALPFRSVDCAFRTVGCNAGITWVIAHSIGCVHAARIMASWGNSKFVKNFSVDPRVTHAPDSVKKHNVSVIIVRAFNNVDAVPKRGPNTPVKAREQVFFREKKHGDGASPARCVFPDFLH